jgi:hypothetical protein
MGANKLSKRVNPHLWGTIYVMTASVVSQNTFFKACFPRRKRDGGLPPQEALFALAHKLIGVIFIMLSQRTYFSIKEVI